MLSADSSYVGLGAVGVDAKACEVGAGGVRSAGIAVMDPVHDRFAPHSFGTVGVDMEAFVGDKPLLALDLPAVSACAVSRALCRVVTELGPSWTARQPVELSTGRRNRRDDRGDGVRHGDDGPRPTAHGPMPQNEQYAE